MFIPHARASVVRFLCARALRAHFSVTFLFDATRIFLHTEEGLCPKLRNVCAVTNNARACVNLVPRTFPFLETRLVRVYFARPTIAIAKMRESQSKDYVFVENGTEVLGAQDVFQFFFAVHLKTIRIRKRSKRRKITRPTFSTVCVSWIRFRGLKSHLELRIFF